MRAEDLALALAQQELEGTFRRDLALELAPPERDGTLLRDSEVVQRLDENTRQSVDER